MKIAVIGAGVVGLTLCRSLFCRYPSAEIDLYDALAIPSNGTSTRNSGVLHAGLYYEPTSLKSILCRRGGILLEEYISSKGLPLLFCGKILVPFSNNDVQRLYALQNRASAICSTVLIAYDEAKRIQPNIVQKEVYLWSPKTKVFSPRLILESILRDLMEQQVNLIRERVILIDSDQSSVQTVSSIRSGYECIYNVAGPGSLNLYQKDTRQSLELQLLPFLGQYAVLDRGPTINTNLYPVPDPNLPFLGVHVTPQPLTAPIIGPNAIPVFRDNLEEHQPFDPFTLASQFGINIAMYIGNRANYRMHANRELSMRVIRKFTSQAQRFFEPRARKDIQIYMSSQHYGIRPQLVNMKTLELYDDFICKRSKNTIHVVNAVSPAFTSAFALADYLIDKFEASLNS